MRDRLDELAEICEALQAQVGKSPFDELVQDALFNILEELKCLRKEVDAASHMAKERQVAANRLG